MEKKLPVLISSLLLIFLYPVLGTLFGAFGGWTVSLFFDDAIHHVIRVFFDSERFDNVSLAQFGAAAGFFSAWLRPSQYTEKPVNKD